MFLSSKMQGFVLKIKHISGIARMEGEFLTP
jgi:hypothetical protein